MTQEDKQVLLTDLCGRLPYGVIVLVKDSNGREYNFKLDSAELFLLEKVNTNIKPYLRPMSSMTEKEKKECYQLQQDTIHVTFDDYDEGYEKTIDLPYFKSLVDFYNSHYLDYRGLIEKNLAIEAPKGMYKTE